MQKDRGAVLTTHSMEEADALCNRVGIMVKGELRYRRDRSVSCAKAQSTPFVCRCLGSTQHLKNKYGGGYMLEIKLKHALTRDWELVETEVMSHFAETVLAEAFSDRAEAMMNMSNNCESETADRPKDLFDDCLASPRLELSLQLNYLTRFWYIFRLQRAMRGAAAHQVRQQRA